MSLATNLRRRLFYGSSAAVIAWAAVTVPLPYLEVVPGAPQEIPPLITIEGADTTELEGVTDLLVVFIEQRTPATAIGSLLDRDRELVPYHDIYPSDVDRSEYLEEERELFGRQFEVAAAVGARAAGVAVELVTEVVVRDVLPGSPADGLLRVGDVVLEADGQQLESAEALQARTREADPGDELELTILRDGEQREVTATLEAAGDEGQARLGVAIQTAVDELRLPFEVTLNDDTRIGGPSAGMMIALTVYDLLSDEDLLDGRVVLGTGTVDADGRVGPVGGVPQKMVASAEHGADLVLVPAAQLEVAREAAPDDLPIVGVDTLDEAIEALRDGA